MNQAAASTTSWASPWMASAHRNSGNANIKASVPALPDPLNVDAAGPGRREHEHRDADDAAPGRARARRPRAARCPATISAIAATSSRMRSATGSSTLPRSLPWSKWRAIQPSTQSEAPSTASSAGRREQLVVGEQPDEDRCAREAHQGDHVRDRDDPRPAVRAHHRMRTRSIQNSPVYAPPSTGMAVPVTKRRRFRAQERRDPAEVLGSAEHPGRDPGLRRIEVAAVEARGCDRCRGSPAGAS